ncbi:MAG: SRPBCC family protein [Thermomicrobiales bacterium]
MTLMSSPQPNPKLDLVLERVVDVPIVLVWKAWTTPELIKKWFAPAPYTTVDCDIDLRPGGIFRTVTRSPEGQEYPHLCTYLDIVENRRLVWTDALNPGYRPSENPFITAVISLEPQGTGTRYAAIAMHKDEDARGKHEEMGFQAGWETALDQLVALLKNG